MSRAAIAIVGLLVATGCAGSAAVVDLDDRWPERPGSYPDVTEAWTRNADDRDGLSMVVDVAATFKSPAWRAAYVAMRAEREGMSDAARAELTAAERADEQKHYEIELLVATYDRRANDLGKGKRSIWRVVLVGEDGREIAPIEIVRDRRPRSEIQAYFPAMGDFHQPYIARFPRSAALLGADVRRLVLRVSSGQGRVELVWRDR